MRDRVPMDVTVSWGKESLARLMRAVAWFDCQITDTMIIDRKHHRAGDPLYLRLQIPPEHLDAFREMAAPRSMREPPKVDLGWTCEEARDGDA